MPLTTKRLISDAVLTRIGGGYVDSAFPVQKEDVWKALEQMINSMFKMQQFSDNLPSGETIPEGSSIATYTDISVTSGNGFSKASLPVLPISLPKNIGVYGVFSAASITSIPQIQFIPLQRGQRNLLKTDLLLNNLMNQIGYEVQNNFVVFSQDITLLGITKVDMDLVVFDMSLYGETDILPIPSNMEEDIVNKLVAMFGVVNPESGSVNLLTTAGQQENK